MRERLRSLWTIPDLRKKILITICLLLIYRVVSHIPVPGIDAAHLKQVLGNSSSYGQLFGLLDVFSGGSFSTFSVVALGVYPYITASIVIQLLLPIIPRLEATFKEGGEAGRLKINQYTRILTIPLAMLQGLGQGAVFVQLGAISSDQFNLFSAATFLQTLATLVTLAAGTIFLVWVGELITENGIGNGISLIIFAGIVAKLPQGLGQEIVSASGTGFNSATLINFAVYGLIAIIAVVGIVFIYIAQRRIPVHYPTKRVFGRATTFNSANQTYIPIPVNSTGMIPLIFGQSLLLFPVVVASYMALSSNKGIKNFFSGVQYWFNSSTWWYWVAYFVLVVMFTFFYAAVVWQQQNISENLQKQGAFVPGIRPGRPTEEYLSKILWRVTLLGALFLGTISVLPALATGVHAISSNQVISAASLLIVVGVVLDTVKQLESQMVMRTYSGFLK